MKGFPVKVKRLDTGEVYPSINIAAKKLFVCPTVLSVAKRKGRTDIFGVPVEFVDTGVGWNAKHVRCVETGDEYPSQTAAAKAVGVNVMSIHYAVNKGRLAGGFHWRLVGKRKEG